ncbi:MAG: hypothetical protein QGG40_16575, partial [Myxococcota bacterium]|nr:hypothetical protein [Myxococcota bacterium]
WLAEVDPDAPPKKKKDKAKDDKSDGSDEPGKEQTAEKEAPEPEGPDAPTSPKSENKAPAPGGKTP